MDNSDVVVAVFVGGIILTILCIISVLPTYFLWNWLMPELFGLKVITFWQAFGLNILATILFKSFQVPQKFLP